MIDKLRTDIIEVLDDYHDRGEFHDYAPLEKERWADHVISLLVPTLEQRLHTEEAKIEVKAKIEALDKLIMGAGEYHDDPYEYVVRLKDIREYRASLDKFDLSQPVFKVKHD